MTLHDALHVPVGIILVAWGGSRVEGWIPRDILIELGEDLHHKWSDSMRPMVMYNNLLYPVHRYTINGFIWYQGCNNVMANVFYAYRLSVMVKHWRKIWGLGDLPFYIVQIAPHDYAHGQHVDAALIREAQYEATYLIPNSGIVGTNDLVHPWEHMQIHPENKVDVGTRLAYMALSKLYGHPQISSDGPYLDRIQRGGNRIIVHLSNTDGGLAPGDGITGFEVANESRVFETADAWLENEKIYVRSRAIPNPTEVRYCFRNFLLGNLYNNRHLPVFPFRSDRWPANTTHSQEYFDLMVKLTEVDYEGPYSKRFLVRSF
jgi:sialate O-acetylesterase